MLARALPLRAAGRAPRGRRSRGRRAPRRAVALRTAEEDRLLVGPDNGLLLPAAERFGGVAEAVEISRRRGGSSRCRRRSTAATCSRPVAARLAAGERAGGRRRRRSSRPSSCALELPARRGARRARSSRHVVASTASATSLLDAGAGRPRRGRARAADRGRRRPCGAATCRTFADVEPGELLALRGRRGGWRSPSTAARRRRRSAGSARRRGAPGRVVSRARPAAPAPARDGSTNERARELAEAGAPHGTLVTARVQTAGRGRQGRRWEAPPGAALLCSLRRARASTTCCRCAPGWRSPTWRGARRG